MTSISDWLKNNRIRTNIGPTLEVFGAEELEDLLDLDEEHTAKLCSELKILEAKRLRQALVTLSSSQQVHQWDEPEGVFKTQSHEKFVSNIVTSSASQLQSNFPN